MKRSLFLINIFLIFLISCHSSHQNRTDDKILHRSDTSIVLDTSNTKEIDPLSGANGANKAARKDSIEKNDKPKAIIHNAPDQEKIDSIKNAKLKEKK